MVHSSNAIFRPSHFFNGCRSPALIGSPPRRYHPSLMYFIPSNCPETIQKLRSGLRHSANYSCRRLVYVSKPSHITLVMWCTHGFSYVSRKSGLHTPHIRNRSKCTSLHQTTSPHVLVHAFGFPIRNVSILPLLFIIFKQQHPHIHHVKPFLRLLRPLQH